jgi:hypothetical protein
MSRVGLIPGVVIGTWETDDEGAQHSVSSFSSLLTAVPFPMQGYYGTQFT